MSRGSARAAYQRTTAIGQHMMSTTTTDEPTVLFESNSSLRTYILNRPKKLNALDDTMLSALRPKIEEWSSSDLCGTIVARGNGRAFCIGGDVGSVANNAADPATRSLATEFFKREFELDFILAALKKPYIAIMDGMTMGGGVGLAANAPFRIATEKTVYAMPETKIGYCPDVGGSYFLSRLDGEIGTYLALTSDTISGRAVFEHGLATHYIPSRRIPMLLDRLAELNQPHSSLVDRIIEDLSAEREPTETPAPFTGAKRVALDYAFRHNKVESIINDLEIFAASDNAEVAKWASDTLVMLHQRSPTSLKVALQAIRRGSNLSLLQSLEMELKIATAFCHGASPDFKTGVDAVIFKAKKAHERPEWSPPTLQEVTPAIVNRFFDPKSPFLTSAPSLDLPAELTSGTISNPLKYALPTEKEIGSVVTGSHASGGGLGLRFDELLDRFAELRPGKMGVKEKLLEVVQRRCVLTDNADGNQVWLKWKH
ncbi:3-hydroxyisobutyryl-CoA hydrolase, mitochondrial [Psilocybe cubensis]|uniref:3-hydroxyisobutyryl-CoA hydrolase n=2 Tax=Psilocybe cubensis TaxID=181762 RepID=A0A8H7Y0E0_PSICU|nr:3-hydroxyisobutyryl-CoA hydrolase, mitochondrial [Psilocybe cubensis]KAH9483961.1 3-hydroxyisobutyryl-CoA hydrolase, mitochondrial [Psilocybe cubensis]